MEMLRAVNGLDDDYVIPEEMTEACRNYFLNGDHTTILAMEHGQVVGCASISYFTIMPTFEHPTGKRAELMNVYTNPEHRRQGIGKHMVMMLIRDACENEATEISLDTTESGRKLYLKLGFTNSGECMVMNLRDLSDD